MPFKKPTPNDFVARRSARISNKNTTALAAPAVPANVIPTQVDAPSPAQVIAANDPTPAHIIAAPNPVTVAPAETIVPAIQDNAAAPALAITPAATPVQLPAEPEEALIVPEKTAEANLALKACHKIVRECHTRCYTLKELITICIALCTGKATYMIIHRFILKWYPYVKQDQIVEALLSDPDIMRRTPVSPGLPARAITRRAEVLLNHYFLASTPTIHAFEHETFGFVASKLKLDGNRSRLYRGVL